MKSKTLDRLDLIRASQEMRLLEEITRQNNRLLEVAEQQQILSNYRGKLAESWQGGTITDAGNLRRSSAFFVASGEASDQIARIEQVTLEALEEAQASLALSQSYRKTIAEVRHGLTQVEERRATTRAELAFSRGPSRSRP